MKVSNTWMRHYRKRLWTIALLLRNTRKSWPPNRGWTGGFLRSLAPRPAALALLTFAFALQAEQFPTLEADDLNGRHVTLPALTQGAPTILIVGFTRSSGEQTKDWTKRIPKDVSPPYSIAVLEDAPRLMRGIAVRSIRSGVPRAQRDHFLILYQNENDLKAAAQFQAADEAYLMVLGPDGSVRWRFHGAFTHTALKQLREQFNGVRQ